MQQHQKIQDPGFAPSFSIYTSNSKISRAVAKVIREEESARFHENRNVVEEDFEFVLVLNDREITSSLGNLFIGDREDSSSSYSSSEASELESPRSRTKSKKSSSTISGAKRWIFRYLIKRSNSECNGESPKKQRNSGKITKVDGRWKAQTPVHELFYVQRRAENEEGKRKSYLPYRKDLVGLFAGKIVPF